MNPRCLTLMIVSLPLLAVSFPVTAQQPELDLELMNYLAGDPVVNRGSDDVLTQLPPTNDALSQKGERLYLSHCAACHGDKLQGQPGWQTVDQNGLLPAPPHDANGHTWHHADDQLFEIVKYGPSIAMQDSEYRSRMPAFGSRLTDEEIISVLVFIRSTWPDQQRDWQSGANDAQTGKQWWREEHEQ